MYLNITIKQSYIAISLVLVCYLLCAFAICLTSLAIVYRLIVFSLLVSCVYNTLKRYSVNNSQVINAISYYDNQWKITIGNQKVNADLIKYFIAYGLVCLYYQANNRVYPLVLFSDSYSQDEKHKLQLGLTLKVYIARR